MSNYEIIMEKDEYTFFQNIVVSEDGIYLAET